MPLLEALEELRRRYPHLEGAYAARWKRMADEGPEAMKADHYHKWTKRKDPQMAAAVHGAFKDLRSKTRIPCFGDGPGRMILTHLIEGKKEDELSEADKRATLAIVEDYMRRKAALTQRAPREKLAERRR